MNRHHHSVSVDQIDLCLPQTQCTLCTYPRCREYAEAIAAGTAAINQCPPGGTVTIRALANLLNTDIIPLNEAHGSHEPKVSARIREDQCIGCKLCIKACPVDCIAGAPKLMHTIIANDCTGCKLCLPVCPTDCIDLVKPPAHQNMENAPISPWSDFTEQQITRARIHTQQKLIRIDNREQERKRRHRKKEREQMKKEIQDALKRKAAAPCSDQY